MVVTDGDIHLHQKNKKIPDHWNFWDKQDLAAFTFF